eukprot:TRINITY_DN16497_c0_g1_i2.p1 TRINITY_DN16497_c0_g1~~TRINITY_DN16497_c0_g1_i2.p1  ORF type:complete len:119 (+),score=1.01 TRINITY_DN16497_c0_g1_i2:123-479(+)
MFVNLHSPSFKDIWDAAAINELSFASGHSLVMLVVLKNLYFSASYFSNMIYVRHRITLMNEENLLCAMQMNFALVAATNSALTFNPKNLSSPIVCPGTRVFNTLHAFFTSILPSHMIM